MSFPSSPLSLALLKRYADTRPTIGNSVQSSEKIAPSVDKAMDEEVPSKDQVEPGISIRNGPADEMDVDTQNINGVSMNGVGAGKRKSRQSLTKGKKGEGSTGSDLETPLVSLARGRAGG